MKIDLDLSELQKVTDKLNDLQINAEQFNQAAQGIRLILQADVDQRFQSSPNTETGGQVWGGEQWSPLSRAYLGSHPRRINGQILRDTGELQQSFTAEGVSVFEVGDRELVFGSALPKASRLNRDRPIVFWHPVLIEKVADFLVKFIDQ